MVKFATAINCIDGRTQIPVIEYLNKKLSVDYIDMITEPGPNKILSENKDAETIKSLREKVEISIEKHNSDTLAIIAHHNCAANPERKDVQQEQLLDAIDIISLWQLNLKRIVALWLDKDFNPSMISDVNIKC